MLSIITSVYGREKYLKRLFASLLRQSLKEFEWIVIDDGSPNSLGMVIDDFKSEALFDITYIRQKHGGKHRAINKGVSISKYDAFIIVDSDDVLIDDALEKMLQWWRTIKEDESFVGAAGLMKGFNGTVSGGGVSFKGCIDIVWSDRSKYGICGESVYIFRRKHWLESPLPEFENEDFLSEATAMYEFSDKGLKIRWYPEIVYIYEYLNDGLTKNINQKYRNSPKGYALLLSKMRSYDYPSKEEYLRKCRDYYELCFEQIENDDICEILGISYDERDEICRYIHQVKKKIIDYLGSEQSCSIYGWGSWGHIMQNYLRMCGKEIDQIIDQKTDENKDSRVKRIDKYVDNFGVVFVCIKNTDDELKSFLASNIVNARIIYMNQFYSDRI